MSEQPPPPPPPPSQPSGPPHRGASGQGPGRSDSRTWGAAAHLSAFVGAWVALAFVGPLVVWLFKRDDDPFVSDHAKEALNFNLTFLIALAALALGGFLLTLVTLGLALIVLVPLGGAVVIGWIVLTIIAAARANEGRHYRYPMTIRFVN